MSEISPALDDLMDRLVATYSDRVANGETGCDDLLGEVPEAQRATLERCFKMIRSGLATAPSAARPLEPGTVLGGYRIVREIGRGGMAIVYQAIQEDLARPVALKVLRPGLALEGRNVDRFKREATTIARLQHPNIVQIHAVGEALGHHFIAMELVEGKTLAQVLSELPTDREWTAHDLASAVGDPGLAHPGESYELAFTRLMVPIVRAIGVAHELGLVHRDVKPSNILFHKDGRPVVADFGLAKGDGDPGLSLTGEPLGTPFYMSPEQASIIQHPVDERTDVYSLGVTLYEGLTGKRPFEGRTVLQVMDAIRHRVPPPPARLKRSIGRDLDALVRKAMAKLPDNRYATALDLSSELVAVTEGRITQAAALESGLVRRTLGAFRRLLDTFLCVGAGEYRSSRTFLGMPLVHVNVGPRTPGEPLRKAVGWIAVGEIAIGGIAFGPFAFGGMAWGAIALGGLSFAGISVGLAALGGIALGGITFGGVSLGYAAMGGVAWGFYSIGGAAWGVHAHTDGSPDEVAKQFFERLFGG